MSTNQTIDHSLYRQGVSQAFPMDNDEPVIKRRRLSRLQSQQMPGQSSPQNGDTGTSEQPPNRKTRGYQLEMLDRSLRENVIVAMDTGSGKTEIAVLRIQKELERCASHKFVWFTAPTVTLAEQQHSVLTRQLPAFQTRLLTGADKVDHWSTKAIWDSILSNMKIVVSTPQVLLDALSNGFLDIRNIALIVFDEAHRCVRNSPANKIMHNFYHYHAQEDGNFNDLPYILGLTASPIGGSSDDELKNLETNLNSVCVAPKVHRDELMQFVHMPEYQCIKYHQDLGGRCSKAEALIRQIDGLDIHQDPFIKIMRERNDLKSQKRIDNALMKDETPCLIQLRRCYNRATSLYQELGAWASENFLAWCLKNLQDKNSETPEGNSKWTDWDKKDNFYIKEVLSKVIPSNYLKRNKVPEMDEISLKVYKLIEFLEKEHYYGSVGIVFAKERATVTMLTRLLSLHPRTKHIKIASFLGSASFASRKSDITEFHRAADQSMALDDLRNGKIDFIIATSVLEEGIDVPDCDLVVCFDPPDGLRPFIQRRGRARRKGSKFAIFMNIYDKKSVANLTGVEDMMKKLFIENERQLEEARRLESIEEDSHETLRVESTGALLTLSNAQSHLAHFCGALSCEFTDTAPEFIISGDRENGFSAKIVLPNFLDPKIRVFNGTSLWRTEKMAKKDAAFRAYSALYKARLVNDNLMPANHRRDRESCVERRPGVVAVSGEFNPWSDIASKWLEAKQFYQSTIEIVTESQTLPTIHMILPVELPYETSFKLFWNDEKDYQVSIKRSGVFPAELVPLARDTTVTLYSALFGRRLIAGSTDFSCLFLPEGKREESAIKDWCDAVTGKIPFDDIGEDPAAFEKLGLIRRTDNRSRPFTFQNFVWRSGKEDEDSEVLHIEGRTWPKRTDFLHPLENLSSSRAHHTATCVQRANECIVDKLPLPYTQFSLFAPCLLHNVEIYLVADELARTVLRTVNFSDLSLVLTAISSSVAREATNYQRLEFLGDSILKLNASLQLSAKHPMWPEGHLSSEKSQIVSNGCLARAAQKVDLHKFILTKPFSGSKWRPSYNSDFAEVQKTSKEMSTKVLADVVEALIGAASIDGGDQRVVECLKVFLPSIDWSVLDHWADILQNAATDLNTPHNFVLSEIEEFLGYTFQRKSFLLTAMTHPSDKTSGPSYQRLEFLGDSLLDIIVVRALFESPRSFAHFDMHLMRTALVSADFLAFLCMNAYIEEDRCEAVPNSAENVSIATTKHKIYLWEFMKHSVSWDVVDAQQRATKQYKKLCAEISQKLDTSDAYPWQLLCSLDAAKFFSDIIESILGAIYIDSHGSFDACCVFLKRIGLMRYLERVLTDEIDFMHPKERLGIQANTLSVRYKTEPPQDGEERLWECTVHVGKEELVRAEKGISRAAAETKAAEVALAILRARSDSSGNETQDDEVGGVSL